jgi:transposase
MAGFEEMMLDLKNTSCLGYLMEMDVFLSQKVKTLLPEQETVPEQERQLKPPHALALKKQFNGRREQEYPWTYDVTKCVVEGAFDDLKNAYDNFFAGRAEYPKYKKKGKSHEAFYPSNDRFTVGNHLL